jgi:hypothetical protein
MLENLSKREKTLALFVGALVPIFLLFWGLTKFSSSYFALRAAKQGLMIKVQDEQDKIDNLEQAQKRRFYYANISAPANASQANIDYQNWLIKLVEGSKLKYNNVTPNKTTNTLSAGMGGTAVPVAEEFTYRINASGTLDQIVDFMDKFNRMNVLHRIKSLDLKKIVDKTDKEGEKGIRLDLEVQLLRLVDAPMNRDFLTAANELKIDNTAKTRAILSRNFFGPANNSPVVKTSSEDFEVALDEETTEVEFDISADDEDDADLLNFELLSSDLEGAQLQQKSPKDRRAKLTAPKVKVGEYSVRVKVSDSGIPQKTIEKTIEVVVEKEKAEPVKEKPKPFLFAATTYITGKRGEDLLINNKAKKDGFMVVKIGGTFELDGETWKVISIDGRIVVIQRGSEIQTFRIGSTLDSPIEKGAAKPTTENTVTESKSE